MDELLGREVDEFGFFGSGYFAFADEVVGGVGSGFDDEDEEFNFGIRPLGSITLRGSSAPNLGIRPKPLVAGG